MIVFSKSDSRHGWIDMREMTLMTKLSDRTPDNEESCHQPVCPPQLSSLLIHGDDEEAAGRSQQAARASTGQDKLVSARVDSGARPV